MYKKHFLIKSGLAVTETLLNFGLLISLGSQHYENKISTASYVPYGRYTECIKKTEQIGNRSQVYKAADVITFLVQVDYFGTY